MRDLVKFNGIIRTGSIDVTERGVTLPDEPATAIKMENWSLLPGLDAPNPADVLWGYHGSYIHWLNAGGNTEFLPITNTSQINLRTKAGETATIFYSFLVDKDSMR